MAKKHRGSRAVDIEQNRPAGSAHLLEAEKPGFLHRRCCTAFRVFPWVPIICSIVLIVGLATWYSRISTAKTKTFDILTELKASQSVLDRWERFIGRIAVAMLICTSIIGGALLVLAVYRLVMESREKGLCCSARGHPSAWGHRVYMVCNASSSVFMWLALVIVFVMVGVQTAWMVTLWAAETGLTEGHKLLANALPEVQTALDSAVGAATVALKSLFKLMDTVPYPVYNLDWFKQVNSTIAPLRLLDNYVEVVCPSACLNMGSLSQVLDSNTCMCNPFQLTKIIQLSHDGWFALAGSLVGLFFIFMGGTWWLMQNSAKYARASDDIKANRLEDKVDALRKDVIARDRQDASKAQHVDVQPDIQMADQRAGQGGYAAPGQPYTAVPAAYTAAPAQHPA